jgi:hypothetical protein
MFKNLLLMRYFACTAISSKADHVSKVCEFSLISKDSNFYIGDFFPTKEGDMLPVMGSRP